jgi:hypothetical protein
MACGTIDDWMGYDKLAVVDHDGPHIDENEKYDVRPFLQREQEWEDVIWNRLGKSIKRVERVACERCWHNPLVVWLVEVLVDQRMMKTTMDQVDKKVGKKQEGRKLQDVVPHSWSILSCIVQLTITPYFSDETERRKGGHDGHGAICLFHFHFDLVFEELRMLEGMVIENEVVGEACDEEVEEDAEKPARGLTRAAVTIFQN